MTDKTANRSENERKHRTNYSAEMKHVTPNGICTKADGTNFPLSRIFLRLSQPGIDQTPRNDDWISFIHHLKVNSDQVPAQQKQLERPILRKDERVMRVDLWFAIDTLYGHILSQNEFDRPFTVNRNWEMALIRRSVEVSQTTVCQWILLNYFV